MPFSLDHNGKLMLAHPRTGNLVISGGAVLGRCPATILSPCMNFMDPPPCVLTCERPNGGTEDYHAGYGVYALQFSGLVPNTGCYMYGTTTSKVLYWPNTPPTSYLFCVPNTDAIWPNYTLFTDAGLQIVINHFYTGSNCTGTVIGTFSRRCVLLGS